MLQQQSPVRRSARANRIVEPLDLRRDPAIEIGGEGRAAGAGIAGALLARPGVEQIVGVMAARRIEHLGPFLPVAGGVLHAVDVEVAAEEHLGLVHVDVHLGQQVVGLFELGAAGDLVRLHAVGGVGLCV